MKPKYLPPLFFLLILFASLVPHKAQALAVPPADLFQLPWDLGSSWIAMDGFDNGTRRERSSPHNYNQGGAVDFAPHIGMKIGEDTSNAWVTAAAAGRIIETSICHVKIDHGNGWVTEYYHLGNIQVVKGNTVNRNQRLAIIDNNEKDRVCVGNRWPGPHLHFVLRPNMRDATLAGWKINYAQDSNITTFTKNSQTVGLFQPLLNDMTIVTPTTVTPSITPSPTITPTLTATDTPSPTPTFTPTETPTVTPTGSQTTTATFTPTGTISPTPTFTPTLTASPTPALPDGLYVITTPNQPGIMMFETTQVGVYLNNVPLSGLSSIELTCSYAPYVLEVSNIADAGLFGADAAKAMNDPQNGTFIVAIAGSNGRRATTSGLVLTFTVRGLYVGQSVVECKARVSSGDNLLTDIPSIPGHLYVYDVTPTPTASFTPTPIPQAAPVVVGQVFASKPVTIRLYNADNLLAAATLANADGAFILTAPAGSYTIIAVAEGFLSAQGSVNMVNGNTSVMPAVALPAGDIDGNNVIDQFDAMTIGMSYGAASPSAADLNSDGVINVLDLELLAANYRKSGALLWQ